MSLWLAIAFSAELRVPEDHATITAALLAARPGDAVMVAGGAYTESLEIPSGVSLIGSATEETVIGPDADGPVLRIAGGDDTTEIRQITLDGLGEVQCLVVPANAGAVALEDVEILRGFHPSRGAGVDIAGGVVTCNRCNLHHNKSLGEGGAIRVENAGLVVRDSSFEANAAATGGAISALGADPSNDVEVHGSSFCDNTATGSGNDAGFGGAIESAYGIDVDSSVFIANKADYGGGIFAFQGSTKVVQNTFSGNDAPIGGAIEHRSGDLLLANNIFAGSRTGVAVAYGAGLTASESGNNLFHDNAVNAASTLPDEVYADPAFLSPTLDCATADVHVGPSSPAIGAGDGEAGLFDDIGAYDVSPEGTDLDGDGSPLSADCDDQNPLVRPGAAEIHCDGLDNDCQVETPDCNPDDLGLAGALQCGCAAEKPAANRFMTPWLQLMSRRHP